MKQYDTTSPKSAEIKPNHQRRLSARKMGWVIATALLFTGLAVAVFLISDQIAKKTTFGIPQFQDNHIELIDQNGIARNEDDFADRPIALFFGFTYCPDVCPTTLTMLAAARDNLDSAGINTKALQIIFITVDPERDTPEQLKQYLSLFDANVTGLTGSPDKVRSVLQQFGVYAQKNGQGDADYLYDHSAAIFLYRGDGSFKGTIVHNEPIAFITEKIKSIL
ncbi:SCO family protein [Alphaproteobacteria bacterium]|nr:SCO family protein [Alphaproteobacteria bacterium]